MFAVWLGGLTGSGSKRGVRTSRYSFSSHLLSAAVEPSGGGGETTGQAGLFDWRDRASFRTWGVMRMSNGPGGPDAKSGGGIQQEVGAGLFLLAIAAVGLFGGLNLKFGTLSEIGPGLFPVTMSVLLGAFGLLLLFIGLTKPGEVLTRWNIRGLAMVLLAVLFFAFFIRGMSIEMFGAKFKIPALGMIVCVPAAIIISAFADTETKLGETVLFGLFMTLLCGFLFKDMLSLPIPFDPLGLVPEPIAQGYAGFKKAVSGVFSSLLRR
jgi:hypothetical protein